MNVSNVEITAGLGGFLVLFGMGLVVWFLGRDLSRRLRRMRQREELRVRDVEAKAEKSPATHEVVSDDDDDVVPDHGTTQDPKRSQE